MLHNISIMGTEKTIIKRLIAALSCLIILSCGFHLRGLSTLPFETVYIKAPNTSTSLDIKRRIQASSNATVVSSPDNAQVILQIIKENYRKIILSVSSKGRVREFQLRYTLSFRLINQEGQEISPATEIIIKQVLPFSDSAFLSSQREETMLHVQMKKDAILRLIYRLGKLKSLS
tara:strand:+ start:129 stop:653 length:525 start_codon:yes stop_codon:yes gene_type:complete